MTAPLRPPSLEAAVGDLWRRVQILEALRPSEGGDYIFLSETDTILTSGTGQDYLEIGTLPTGTYRHYVFEVKIAAILGSETEPSLPGNLIVDINSYQYTYAPQIVYADDVEPTVPIATLATDNEDEITIEHVVSFVDGSFFGAESRLTFHFPYIGSPDGDDRSVGGWFQGVALGQLNASTGGAYVAGGIITEPQSYGIEYFALRSGRRDFSSFIGAWSNVTTYNAGDAVSYLGKFWISLTTNTNSAPVPPDGGTDWMTFYRPLNPGSKISAYGIR